MSAIARRVPRGIGKAALVVLALVFLTPLYITIVDAFKTNNEIITRPLALPGTLRPDNFVAAMRRANVLDLYKNSLLITVTSVVLLLLVTSMAAFVLARRDSRLYRFLYVFSLLGIMVPPVVALVPSLLTLKTFGLLHTYLGLFFFYGGTFFSVGTFLYVGFIKTIPYSLDESALIDGAGQFTIFFRIIFPLVKPCTASTSIFVGMWIWNDFLNPLYILGSNTARTITTGIYSAIGRYTTLWNLVFASVILASLPIVVFYLSMQRMFIRGLTSGAVKG